MELEWWMRWPFGLRNGTSQCSYVCHQTKQNKKNTFNTQFHCWSLRWNVFLTIHTRFVKISSEKTPSNISKASNHHHFFFSKEKKMTNCFFCVQQMTRTRMTTMLMMLMLDDDYYFTINSPILKYIENVSFIAIVFFDILVFIINEAKMVQLNSFSFNN